MNDNTFTNKLADELSPYLQQHKNNPVEWYPWSEEAFEKAKTENKPVLLSIGYSTCTGATSWSENLSRTWKLHV